MGAAHDGVELERGLDLPFEDLERAALRVRDVVVAGRTHDQPAVFGLAHVDMEESGHDDAVQYRLEAVGHQGLERGALDGEVEPRHPGQKRCPSGAGERDLPRRDRSP
jgi:hypothetical protein